MTKKSKIFYYTLLAVNLGCFLLDWLPFPVSFSFFDISFPLSLCLIGLQLVIRAFNLKIDSSLFFGIVFFGCGLIIFVLYFGKRYWGMDFNQTWPYYFFVLAVASLCTSIYFKDKLQAKLCLLFIGFGFITLLFVQDLINLYLFIGLAILWFVIYFVSNLLINKKRRDR